MESIALFDASVEQTFHFLSRNFSGCFGAETDQLVADGFEKQTQFRAFDDQRINVKQLNVREQASSVFLAEFWIGVFVRVGVSANQRAWNKPPPAAVSATGNGIPLKVRLLSSTA